MDLYSDGLVGLEIFFYTRGLALESFFAETRDGRVNRYGVNMIYDCSMTFVWLFVFLSRYVGLSNWMLTAI